jgi:peptide/nickel transport system permease protein
MALLLLSSLLLIIGNLLADLALAWVDPRIRYG